jgi:hypothetical protein
VPTFENRVTFKIAQGIKAFLSVEVGIVRERIAELGNGSEAQESSGTPGQDDARAQGLNERENRRVGEGRPLGSRDRRGRSPEETDGIRPENMVWIFATARTGSTWLGAMMDEMSNQTVWREPLVGQLFGYLYYDRAKHLIGKKGKHFILGDGYRDSWLNSIRSFVLNEATPRFPEAARPDNYLVVKEPNGSIGAPLLMEALPESRMILLVRDPRDVAASSMDARRKGGWQYESRNKGVQQRETLSDKDPDAFVRTRARAYLEHIEKAKQAYDAHEGHKVIVKYEDLRADTLGTMKRLYSALEIPVDERELIRAVEKHAWENIPEKDKGEGKFYRKASPGGWREDLTPEQAEIVERITAPLLKEFYTAWSAT